MIARHLRAGRQAEAAARCWLQRRGLRHIASNYRCRFGELDLVMLDGDCLVIVEVRLRSSSGFGGAIASVTTAKQRKLARATQCFLGGRQLPEFAALRFDVLALTGPSDNPCFEWRRDAFNFDEELE